MHIRLSLILATCLLACDRTPTPEANVEANEPGATPSKPATPATPSDEPESDESKTPEVAPMPELVPQLVSESIEELEARAWKHYRAEQWEAAGAAFVQLAERMPTVWKHPYNAACTAALRNDYGAAQLALVDAFRRGGDAARNKAKRDDDLVGLRTRSWWPELLAADDAQLAVWRLREDLPAPKPDTDGSDNVKPSPDTPMVSRLTPYGPGESPVEIRDLKAEIAAPYGGSSAWRLNATFDVDKREAWIGGAWLLTTCEADGRYFAANNFLDLRDVLFAVGRSRSFEIHAFSEVFTRELHEWKRCELRFIHIPDVDTGGRVISEACTDGKTLQPGPCKDFQRVSATKLEARITSRVMTDTARKVVWAYAELGAGGGPRPSERYHINYDCNVEGRRVKGALALLTPGRYDFMAPGEVMQGQVLIDVGGVPDGCELVLGRTCCDQGQDTGIAPVCATAAGQTAGPCAFTQTEQP